MTDKKRVLILCTGNSARSQMAEGLLRHDSGDRFDVESAGTKPGRVRPEAIQAMREIGIDISGHRSKSVDEFAGQDFDYVLTVCDHAKETCPIYPGHSNRMHHNFQDPAAVEGSEEQRLAAFREVRDEVAEIVDSIRKEPHPAFLEVRTYRYRGHSMSDPASYRTKQELEKYRLDDPITRLRAQLTREGKLTNEQFDQLDKQAKETVMAAVKFAEESPEPPLDKLYDYTYADGAKP